MVAQDYPNSPSFSSGNSNVSFIEMFIGLLIPHSIKTLGLPRWPGGKQSACQGRRCRDADSILGSGGSSGGGNGNPLQYSCLGNSMKRETWRAIVHDVTKHQTQLYIAVVHLLSCLTLFRLPGPSLSPGVCSNSYPLSWWCHPTILYCVTLFSSCPQSFPASGSFPISWLFAPACIGASASASTLPMNIQGWFL